MMRRAAVARPVSKAVTRYFERELSEITQLAYSGADGSWARTRVSRLE
jgi:hypothetical protein